MRVQTSLEFMIILAAVSGLSLTAIIMFHNLSNSAGQSLSYISNSSSLPIMQSSQPISINEPALNIHFPAQSIYESENPLQVAGYGCDEGIWNFSISSNSISFLPSSYSSKIQGISSANLSFVPLIQGVDNASLSYLINCTGTIDAGTINLMTYSSLPIPSTSLPGSQSYAYFSNRSETVLYPLQNQGQIENLSIFNQCTKVNFFGNPIGVTGQCSDISAYDYRITDPSCVAPTYSYSRTYCVIPDNFSYALASPEYNYQELDYSFQLNVVSPSGTLTTSVSNSSNSSYVYENGRKVGTASINGAYYSGSEEQNELLWLNNTYLYPNISVYQQYSQLRNELFPLLSYYNGTQIPGSMQITVQQYITELQQLAPTLISTAKDFLDADCTIESTYYSCIPSSPFTYRIEIILNETSQNETLTSEGSIIDIR